MPGQTETQIGPVPEGAASEALQFVAGGRRRDVSAALRAEGLQRAIGCGDGHWLWWARRGGRCVGASLVLAGSGRVGMLSCSPAGAPGVDAACVSATIRGAARRALGDGLAFVQSLLAPTRREDIAVLVSAGLHRLAELAYLRLDLTRPVPREDEGRYAWRTYRRYGEEELLETVEATYVQSCDCPGLRGLRRIADVIEGHKASGVFSPRSWWIVFAEGRPAGCILVNGSSVSPGSMDVVYLGVAAAFRGRGIGRAMVRRAARWARRRKRRVLTVAVDTGNDYARRIYDEAGFRETSRRLAYILPMASPQAEPTGTVC